MKEKSKILDEASLLQKFQAAPREVSLSLFSKHSVKSFFSDAGRVAFFVSPAFFLYLFTVFFLDYTAYNNSSDSFLYLDIAKNILAGRGPVISFNVYRFWDGIFYPALPFVHIVLPLVLAVLYAVFGTFQALVISNLVVAFFTLFLVYRIVLRLYEDAAVAAWSVAIIAATISFETTILRLLTEQASLFVTLLAVRFFISEGKNRWPRLWAAALLLGFGVFIRSASIIYPLAFALVLGASREEGRFRKALFLLAAPLAIVGLYEVFVFARYHLFFPQYPRAFKEFFLAERFVSASPSSYGTNIRQMAAVFQSMLNFFVFVGGWHLVRAFREKRLAQVLFAWILLLQVGSTICFYPFLEINVFELTRFLFVPIAILVIFGIAEFRRLCRAYFVRLGEFFFYAVVIVVFVSNLYQSFKVLELYAKRGEINNAVAELRDVAAWVGRHTGALELIGVSEFFLSAIDLDRPVVALPLNKMLDRKSYASFLKKYAPRAVIFEKTVPIEAFLREEGYRRAADWPLGSEFLIFQRP